MNTDNSESFESPENTELANVPKPPRVYLDGIDSSAFQHPLDREAVTQLKRMQGFDKFMAMYLEFGHERFQYILNNANYIRVGPRQYPRLYAMLQEGCKVLDMPEPEMYISNIGIINAWTSGHNNPYIVVEAFLLDLMSDEEIMAVIAHELGHIKCGHVLYSMMAESVGNLINIAGSLTPVIGSTFSTFLGSGIQVALFNWQRRSELSADRAALLVSQNVRPCISMLMKLAGGSKRMIDDMDVEEFFYQAQNYHDDASKSISDRVYRIMTVVLMQGRTHPFAVERAKALNEWIETPEYDQILSGNYARGGTSVKSGVCPRCTSPVAEGYVFCGVCGFRLSGN